MNGRAGTGLIAALLAACQGTVALADIDVRLEKGGSVVDQRPGVSAKPLGHVARTCLTIETEAEPCEKCGKPMVLRRGRYGQFLACSGYPDCKTTRKVMVSKDGKKLNKRKPCTRNASARWWPSFASNLRTRPRWQQQQPIRPL